MAAKLPPPPEVQAALTEASKSIELTSLDRLEVAAAQIVISDDESMESANNIRRMAKGLQKQWEEFWAPKIAAAWNVHKMLKSAMNPVSERLSYVVDQIIVKQVAYKTKQEKIKEAIEREALRKAEEEQALKLQAAEAAMERGDVKQAKQLIAESTQVTAIVLPNPVAKMEGTSFRETWDVEVIDLVALAKDVAEGRAPLDCIKEDVPFLRSEARKFQGMPYAGVRAFTKQVVADRGL